MGARCYFDQLYYYRLYPTAGLTDNGSITVIVVKCSNFKYKCTVQLKYIKKRVALVIS